jgi:methylenetetrahydrofolate reductase (NADPH)
VTNIGTPAGHAWTAATAQCPKHMTHGPCAGVLADGRCEVPGIGPCSYLAVPDDEWPFDLTSMIELRTGFRTRAAAAFCDVAATRPVVVVDLVAPPLSADGVRAAAREMREVVDACLIGDHGGARVQFPPSYRARLLADEGVPAWVGINCRDRNRVAIEGEIAACIDAGAVGVHCVTGDHTRIGHRADAAPVFDLDCIDVVALTRPSGLLCSVAHAPAAPPVHQRLPRLLVKVAAGADVVFVDHCGGSAAVADAVAAVRGAAFTGLVIACVPVVTGPASATVLASFAGDRLPSGYAERIVGARDPAAAGIAAATELAEAMLEIPGVDGVDLSAGALPGHERAAAGELAETARRVLGASQGARTR